MALIVVFLLSTIFLIVPFEPFRTAGIFLSICYLPGLCMFAIKRGKEISFEDLVLAFPCSVGLSSLLILALLFLGVQINYIPLIIHTIIGIAVILYIVDRKKNNAVTLIEVNKQDLLFCFLALLTTIILSIPLFIGPNRVGIAAHAFHHSLMVAQIMNGIFPPENPGLGGTIIGYYWGFHSLIAALTIKSYLHQLQIVFLLNLISLYFIFCISYCIAKVFGLSKPYCYILPLAVMGLMRADAGILFLVKLVKGSLLSFDKITAFPIEPEDVLLNWISGLSWIDTRLFILRKLYNISGMLLAVTMCYSYLLVLLIVLKRKFTLINIYLISLALVISAGLINYPPLAIFLLLHAPLWSCYIFLSSRGDLKIKFVEASKIAVPFIIAVSIVTPYLLFVMASRNVSSGGQGGIFSFAFYDQSYKNMVVFLIPLPLIIYGAWIALRRLSLSREFNFLFISTTLCLVLTVFTRWPFDNSYKFNYILSIFFALFFVVALSHLLTFIFNNWLKRLIIAGTVLFLSLTPVIDELSHIVSAFSTDYIYEFSGGHLAFAQDKQRNQAFTWIRENTSQHALLMLSYIETDWPCCAFNNNYKPAAFAERTLYVIKDKDYTTSNPEYAKRVEMRERLFENPKDPEVVNFFTSLKHPVYLLIEDNLPEDTFFVEERFKRFPEKPGEPFELLFRNERQRVYLIQFSKNNKTTAFK